MKEKPIQWNKHGDHPHITKYEDSYSVIMNWQCSICGKYYFHDGQYTHGRIEGTEFDRTVCPGDWIYRDQAGNFYPDNNRHLIDELREKGQIRIQAMSSIIHDIMYEFDNVDVRYADQSFEYWLITLTNRNMEVHGSKQ